MSFPVFHAVFLFCQMSIFKTQEKILKKLPAKFSFLYVYKIYCGLFLEDVNDETEFTLENINRQFGGEDPQENFRNLWKTSFDEGISREDVLKDDDLMKHEHKQWRYDYAFVTKSGNTCSKYCELLYKYYKALSKYVHATT